MRLCGAVRARARVATPVEGERHTRRAGVERWHEAGPGRQDQIRTRRPATQCHKLRGLGGLCGTGLQRKQYKQYTQQYSRCTARCASQPPTHGSSRHGPTEPRMFIRSNALGWSQAARLVVPFGLEPALSGCTHTRPANFSPPSLTNHRRLSAVQGAPCRRTLRPRCVPVAASCSMPAVRAS